MSPPFRFIQFKGPEHQRGAIGLMAALTLGLVLLFMLLVVDSGRLYLEQRKLQRVADLAVLEAVSRGGSCTAGTAPTYANESATRNSFKPGATQKVNTTCGTLVTGSDNLRAFKLDSTKSDAIRVIATTTVPTSVAGGLWSFYSNGKFLINTPLTASAVGAAPKPLLAQINIRTTLASITTNSQAALLNGVTGALAGGSINLSIAGWNGLLGADVNLLSFMDRLAIDLGVKAGDYNKLLSTNATLTQLVNAAASVANATGATTDLQAAVAGLQAAVKLNPTVITLGELLKLNTGSPSSGLDANLKLGQLVEAFLQVANTHNALDLNAPLILPGIANVSLKMKVIEPPQFSAIGDPSSGQVLSVRTAQVRTLISIDLTGLSKILDLPEAVKGLTNTLVTAVGDLLNLNLVGLVTNLLCLTGCKQISPVLLPDPKIYLSLDAGGADATITGYTCPIGGTGSKSLTVKTNKSLIDLRVGKLDPATVFSTTAPPVVSAVPIIDLGIQTCYKILGVLGGCDKRVAYAAGGIGIMANTSVLKTPDSTLIFSKATNPDSTPPDLKLPSAMLSTPQSTSIINSLNSTISGIQIESYKPSTNNIFSTVLTTATTAISAVANLLKPIINNLLSPLLTPIINNLLTALGISLVDVEVGANLTCGQGGRAQLVL
ncbi:pilus assembly protein TadG-related protein [Pseudomonas helleri]|uniref:pilus assembly protein TadG-related protein n=1 Tax=Pseudomonas helleri TaxID=1608996 RepID=UPI0030DB1D61